MVRFVIVRHGYSQYNKERRYTGQVDVPLDVRGVAQAQDACVYLLANYKIDAVYSSDLGRAIETARPVAEALGLPIIQDKDLREVDLGKWHNMLIDDVTTVYADELRQLRENPGHTRRGEVGETDFELRERVVRSIKSIARENEGKTVMVASHGGTIRSMCGYFHGYDVVEQKKLAVLPNASITVVDYDVQTEHAQTLLYGYTDHLRELSGKGLL